ncbi:hypothetical protein HRbin39_00520 [bacterium HR39]|nr:hypothetical protein HRbin39_00520 [bacterium HR39]
MLLVHGVEGGPGVAARHAVDPRLREAFAAVRPACLRGEPALETVLAGVRAPAVVVPLLLARGYIFDWARERIARIRPDLPVSAPVGVHPGCAALMREMALGAAAQAGFDPAASVLLLVGHGTPKHPETRTTLERHAARLALESGFARVETAFLECEPLVTEVVATLGGASVVAVAFFVDAGPHGRDDVGAALAPLGENAIYAGPVGLHPALPRLIRDVARVALAAGEAAAVRAG